MTGANTFAGRLVNDVDTDTTLLARMKMTGPVDLSASRDKITATGVCMGKDLPASSFIPHLIQKLTPTGAVSRVILFALYTTVLETVVNIISTSALYAVSFGMEMLSALILTRKHFCYLFLSLLVK
jgi:hypothetical protein